MKSENVFLYPGERICELLDRMTFRRQTLLGILEFCTEPQTVEDVRIQVDQLQRNNHSVWGAASLCSLLEQAGALVRLSAEGTVIDSQAAREPQTVKIEGVAYLQAEEPSDSYWSTTVEGLSALEADRPYERLTTLFAEEADYLPIYERVLTLCSTEEGALTRELDEAVDNDPLVQEPRYFAPRFVERLEGTGALVWEKTWRTTDIGQRGLALLSDGYAFPSSHPGNEV